MSVLPTVVPKYSREAYAKMASLMAANGVTYPSYEKFVENSLAGQKKIIEMGCLPHEIEINPLAYEAWCKSETRPIGRESLSEFLMLELGKRFGRKN